jgi:N-acetylmuramoyl-L-alanine amidase
VAVAAIVGVLIVSAPAAAQTARARYEAAIDRETQVRLQLTSAAESPTPELSRALQQVVAAFETIVRRFPASGYADNALWQGAGLADAAFQKFSRADDRERALRLYRWLVKEYPTSSLVRRANGRIAALAKPEAIVAPAAATVAPANLATLTAIQRTVLPGSVRVVLELDREVTYREERLFGPARLFFDMTNVQLTPELLDKTLSYPTDVINKIRLGRHPDNVVRVVLDIENVTKYSVFTLYSPFRLVVDAERTPVAPPAPLRAVAIPSEPLPVLPSLAPTPSELPKAATAADVALVAVEAAPPVVESPAPAPAPAEVVAAPAPVATPPGSTAPARPSTPSANVAGGYSIARQLGLGVSRIVIDPGHGGHDPGVLGRGLSEAALVLDVALRLEKLLAKEEGVDVVLTRRTDAYVPLEERTAIANRHNADLFLSIHANASRNTSAKGIETFYLSFASSPDAEAVAARENSASEQAMHQLPDLIKKITLNNKLDESRDLANMVQEALITNLRKSNKEVRSRGVKKAPFVVLIGAEMPSVLAEISFLSNRQELSLLKTANYKQRIAQSLFNAVMKYRRSLKTQMTMTLQEQ